MQIAGCNSYAGFAKAEYSFEYLGKPVDNAYSGAARAMRFVE